MNYEVAMTTGVSGDASAHLLRHYQKGGLQEDLCFALWRPSTGLSRQTGLVYEVLLPKDGERLLHGNASFQPGYMARSIRRAMEDQAGLAFMHSHPGKGWQDMSPTDVVAERDVLAYPAGATDLPLLGLTIGADGYWSARFWEKCGDEMTQHQCRKVRVVAQIITRPTLMTESNRRRSGERSCAEPLIPGGLMPRGTLAVCGSGSSAWAAWAVSSQRRSRVSAFRQSR